MYQCESWTIKKAEHGRIHAFKLQYWRRFLRVPWTVRRSNESILKEINPSLHWKDGCWSWSFSTLATWCEELTHWKRPWCWERLKAGGEGDDRGWDGWMASWTQWTWVWVSSGSWWWTGKPGMVQSMGSQRVRYEWATELNWTELKYGKPCARSHIAREEECFYRGEKVIGEGYSKQSPWLFFAWVLPRKQEESFFGALLPSQGMRASPSGLPTLFNED